MKIFVRVMEIVILVVAFSGLVSYKTNHCSYRFEEDDFTYFDNNEMAVEDIWIKRGSYDIYINCLSSETGGSFSVFSKSLYGINLRASAVALPTDSTESVLHMEAGRGCKDMRLVANPPQSGEFTVYDVNVVPTKDYAVRHMVIAVLLCLVLEMLILLSRKPENVRRNLFLIAVLSLAASYPLFIDYLTGAHDISFHLARIEGISLELKNGVFPVKMQSFWGNGYGYPVGVFYPDLFLYFPAVLRLLGFSVQAAYKIYVFAVNLGTAVISFYSFKKIFKSEKVGMVGAWVYTLALYRLIDVYTRASVGEYTAIAFFPMILCGFYILLTYTGEQRKEYAKGIFYVSIGLCGVIFSHVLSIEMMIMFVVAALLVCVKRAISKRNLVSLVMALVTTICLSLWFVVPFLDYYSQTLKLKAADWSGAPTFGVSEYGTSLIQLFSVFGFSVGGCYQSAAGITGEVSIGIGLIFVLALLVFIYLALFVPNVRQNKFYKTTCFATVCAGLCLYMSTVYFPWTAVSDFCPILEKVITPIQFPWRFLGFATVFLTVTVCFDFCILVEHKNNKFFAVIPVAAAVGLISVLGFFSDFMRNSEGVHIYDTCDVASNAFYSEEYLLEGTKTSQMVPYRVTLYSEAPDEDGCMEKKTLDSRAIEESDILSEYTKKGTEVSFRVNTSEKTGIELPLNYYRYYKCFDTNNNHYAVKPGINNCVSIELPENLDSKVYVKFKEPAHWRVAELLSLLSAILLGIFYQKQWNPGTPKAQK